MLGSRQPLNRSHIPDTLDAAPPGIDLHRGGLSSEEWAAPGLLVSASGLGVVDDRALCNRPAPLPALADDHLAEPTAPTEPRQRARDSTLLPLTSWRHLPSEPTAACSSCSPAARLRLMIDGQYMPPRLAPVHLRSLAPRL